MSLHELSNEMNGMVIERNLKHQDSESTDGGHHERGHLTRKSSTSSNCSSGFDKRRNFYRKDSEVKMEAIFKELFSPDAKIVDHYEGEILMIPGIEVDESSEDVEIPSHDRFKLRRQTSLLPKEAAKKNASPQPRLRVITRKSPSPMRKLSTPSAPRKRSTSSRAPLPKMSAPPSLKPNFVTVADDSASGSYLRKNRGFFLFLAPFSGNLNYLPAIPLRRGLSISQK
uniref:Cyclin-dependent kinase inhibitor n=1 Tax=Caenorhabditis tropicalis TaxID=1561998 RepID=A0A1I7SY80_9PELO